MGHHEDGGLQGVTGLLKGADHRPAGLGIQVAGGLVGQNQQRAVDEGPGHGGALLLAAGDLRGVLAPDVADAEEENDERAIFYSRSVLETVKKLRWSPDIVHCHGWVSALVPLYIKKSYNEEPSYRNSKIVYSLYGGALNNRFPASFRDKLIIKGVSADDVKCCGDETGVSINDLSKLAIDYSDGIILHGDNIAPEVMEYLDKSGKPYIKYEDTPEFIDKCNQLYEQVS